MSDGPSSIQDAHYRRGVVLGLTIGEAILLLLFCLLLVMAVPLAQYKNQALLLSKRIIEVTTAATERDTETSKLRELIKELEGVAGKRIEDITKEYALNNERARTQDARVRAAIAQAEQLRQTVAALRQQIDKAETAAGKKIDEIVKEYASRSEAAAERDARLKEQEQKAAAFEQLVEATKSDMSAAHQPEAVAKELAREVAAFRKLGEEISEALGRNVDVNDPVKAIQAIKDMAAVAQKASMADLDKATLINQIAAAELKLKDTLEKAQATQRELANAQGQFESLRRKVGDGGRGVDHAPCWATPAGKPEYIFDIAVTERGMTTRDRKLPHRRSEQAMLPTADMVFDSEVSPQRFLSMAKPLLDWSAKQKPECRFWVRVFDKTADHQKAIYKRQIRIVGDRFYIFEERHEQF